MLRPKYARKRTTPRGGCIFVVQYGYVQYTAISLSRNCEQSPCGSRVKRDANQAVGLIIIVNVDLYSDRRRCETEVGFPCVILKISNMDFRTGQSLSPPLIHDISYQLA